MKVRASLNQNRPRPQTRSLKSPDPEPDPHQASIDNDTDAVLQTAIRKAFEECTVLTIAHRLHTVMDSSEIMLFEAGSLAEHAPPHLLLDDPVSLFSKLVDDTGSAADHLRKLAREAHEARTAGAV